MLCLVVCPQRLEISACQELSQAAYWERCSLSELAQFLPGGAGHGNFANIVLSRQGQWLLGKGEKINAAGQILSKETL